MLIQKKKKALYFSETELPITTHLKPPLVSFCDTIPNITHFLQPSSLEQRNSSKEIRYEIDDWFNGISRLNIIRYNKSLNEIRNTSKGLGY